MGRMRPESEMEVHVVPRHRHIMSGDLAHRHYVHEHAHRLGIIGQTPRPRNRTAGGQGGSPGRIN